MGNESGNDGAEPELFVSSMPDSNYLVPHLDIANLPKLELSAEEWEEIVTALGRDLISQLRERLAGAVGYFVHTLRLKEELPTPRRYLELLQSRAADIGAAANELRAFITPIGHRSVSNASASPAETEAEEIFPIKPRKLEKAMRAAVTGNGDSPVLTAEDHIRCWVFHNHPEVLRGVHIAMAQLEITLNKLRLAVSEERAKQPKAGADGHFELKILVRELLAIASEAGDNLHLPSKHECDEAGTDDTFTPAYDFVEKVLALVRDQTVALVYHLEPIASQRPKLSDLLSSYLKPPRGGFIALYLEARAAVEETPRR